MKLLGKLIFILLLLSLWLNAKDNYIKIDIKDSAIYLNKPFSLNVEFKYKINTNIQDVNIYLPNLKDIDILQKSSLVTIKRNNFIIGKLSYLMKLSKGDNLYIDSMLLSIKKENKDISIKSNTITSKIIKMPTDVNLIGDYDISSTISTGSNKNNIVYLNLIFKGTGYTELTKDFNLTIPSAKVFIDTDSLKCEKLNYQFKCKRDISYSILGIKSYKIPSIKLKYLDLNTSAIIIKDTDEKDIIVKVQIKAIQDIINSKISSIVINKRNDILLKTDKFYIILVTIFITILFVIIFFIYRYKLHIKKVTPRIILLINSKRTCEELYEFLFPYFGLNKDIDKQILLIKIHKNDIELIKKEITEIIKLNELYDLFKSKSYEITKSTINRDITLDEKITKFQESIQYKVDRENIIKIKNRTIDIGIVSESIIIDKESMVFNKKKFFSYFNALVHTLGFMMIFPLIMYVIALYQLIDNNQVITLDIYMIPIIGIILLYLLYSIYKQITKEDIKLLHKIIVYISSLYLVAFIIKFTKFSDYTEWIGFILLLIFIYTFIEVFEKGYNNNQSITTEVDEYLPVEHSNREKLKLLERIFYTFAFFQYIWLYYYIYEYTLGTFFFFLLSPLLVNILLYEFVKRYWIYKIHITNIITYYRIKSMIFYYIVALFLMINTSFSFNLSENKKFILSAQKGNKSEIVRILKNELVSVNLQDENGNSALHHAVNREDVEMLKILLLDPKISVNIINFNGKTALHYSYTNYNRLYKTLGDPSSSKEWLLELPNKILPFSVMNDLLIKNGAIKPK